MWEWYRIGLSAGLGAAVGVLASGALGANRAGATLALAASASAGAGIGLGLDGWEQAVGGALGGGLGALGALQLVQGTLRRGGTRLGTAVLVGGGSVALAAAAFVPFVGYLEALVVPALGARLRGRGGERYAGLRILARD